MNSYILRPDTFTLNFNFTLSGTKSRRRGTATPGTATVATYGCMSMS